MRYATNDLDKEYLAKFGLPASDAVTVDENEMTIELEQCRIQHPEESSEQRWARALARCVFRHKVNEPAPEPPAVTPAKQEEVVFVEQSRESWWKKLAIAMVIIWIVSLVSISAHCQMIVTFKDSAGTVQKRYAAPFTMKAGTNVTFTPGASQTLTISSADSPVLSYKITHSGQTGSISTVTVSGLANGLYRFSFYSWTTTTGSAGSCQLTDTWNNGTAGYGGNVGGALSLTATTAPRELTKIARIGNGQMQYTHTCTGITGNPVYSLSVTLERIAD